MDLRNEICQVEDLLATATDEQQRYKALKRLNVLTMKLGVTRPSSALLDEHRDAGRIVDRLCRHSSKSNT
jgi:hypothetical protein